MARICKTCNRPAHAGLCDMAELSDGRIVHTSRIDNLDGDIRAEIDTGQVKVSNRFIKKKDKEQAEPKTKARRS